MVTTGPWTLLLPQIDMSLEPCDSAALVGIETFQGRMGIEVGTKCVIGTSDEFLLCRDFRLDSYCVFTHEPRVPPIANYQVSHCKFSMAACLKDCIYLPLDSCVMELKAQLHLSDLYHLPASSSGRQGMMNGTLKSEFSSDKSFIIASVSNSCVTAGLRRNEVKGIWSLALLHIWPEDSERKP
ncbi:hypothetical protein BTVI_07743 [Pitangus sulphuratus]|nr:hypothetical protein BTVI_07743 [Pitangus sulphuratus]